MTLIWLHALFLHPKLVCNLPECMWVRSNVNRPNIKLLMMHARQLWRTARKMEKNATHDVWRLVDTTADQLKFENINMKSVFRTNVYPTDGVQTLFIHWFFLIFQWLYFLCVKNRALTRASLKFRRFVGLRTFNLLPILRSRNRK